MVCKRKRLGVQHPLSCSGQVQLTWGSTRSYLGLYSNTLGQGMGTGGTEGVGLQVPKVGELWGRGT